LSLRRLLPGAALLFSLCLPTATYAQDPIRITGDTTRAAAERDSLIRVDSMRVADAVRDSLRRAFPDLPQAGTPGFAAGVWEWDRAAILREAAITVGDLLRRIPGMTALRAGGYVQPEAVTAFGQTRGRIEFELDGYVLDPLQASTYDVAAIEMINITSLRVERRLDVTRVRITTATPTLGTPYTRIEAATGEPDMNAFRAIFLVPYVVVGPLGVALDRVDSDGLDRREPASALTGWAKWTWTNGERGLQLEYRRQNMERETLPWPTDRTRSDILLRGRAKLLPGLTAELYGGHSQLAVEPPDSTSSDAIPAELREPPLERSAWQAGARAAFSAGAFNFDGALRTRTRHALPSLEGVVNADVGIGALLRIGGGVTHQTWRGGLSLLSWDARAQTGSLLGLSAFAEMARGERGAPIYADSAGTSIVETVIPTDREGLRLGGQFNHSFRHFDLNAGGAWVRLSGDIGAPFGLPFDSAFVGSPIGERDGVEAWGRLGLFRNRIALDGSYTFWHNAQDWIYLPTRNWRVAAETHFSPLESGNLEIFGRLESVRRGPMLAFSGLVPDGGDQVTGVLPASHQLNGYLQIRVIDVRAFIQYEDMLNKGRLDIPGRFIRGPRFFYGVKWELLN
jgi:hypothetical protein